MKQVEDAEILEKFSREDSRNEGFNLLLQKYKQKLYWHIRRMVIDHDDADDIIQEVFLKIWKSLNKFRHDAQLYTWLYRIATNECITFLTKKKQQHNVSIDEVYPQLETTLVESPYFDGDKIQLKFQKAILKLPDKQRLIFNLKYFDELKYDEISEITGTSIGALKASFHIAVKKIEALMLNDEDLI